MFVDVSSASNINAKLSHKIAVAISFYFAQGSTLAIAKDQRYSLLFKSDPSIQVFAATLQVRLLFKSAYSSSLRGYSSSLRGYSSSLRRYSSSLRRYSSKCPVQRRLLAVPSSRSASNQCLKSMQG